MNWNIIENTEDLHNVFPNSPMIGYRRLPNLRQLLTSSSICYPPPSTTDKPKSFIPVCTRLGKCTYCPKIKKIDSFVSHHTQRTFKCQKLPPKAQITCELYNIIYMITCTYCGLHYIGESKRGFRHRMYEHMRSATVEKLKDSTPVSRHFTQKNHSVKNMEFSIIHWLGTQLSPDSTKYCRDQELYYIWEIPNLSPAGINVFM